MVVLGLVGGALQIQALVAQMPQVLVLGVVGLAVDLQGDVMSLGVVDLFVTALDVPLTPGSNDGHIGAQGFEGQLKTHLIVALASAAVADGIRAFLDGDIGQSLCNAGACKAGAQQVVLVLCTELQGGEDVVLHKVLLQIQNVQLGSAGSLGLFLQAVQLGALAHVTGNGDDFAVVVVFLQPGNDDGGIQTTGVGQNDFFDVFLFHGKRSFAFMLHFCFLCRASLPARSFRKLFIIRHAAFPSMLKTAKHAAHLRQDLLQFVCLCNIICLYSNFMQLKCIYEMQKSAPKDAFFMPGIFPESPPPVPVSAGGWAPAFHCPCAGAATRWTGPASRTYRQYGAHGPRM